MNKAKEDFLDRLKRSPEERHGEQLAKDFEEDPNSASNWSRKDIAHYCEYMNTQITLDSKSEEQIILDAMARATSKS